MAFTAEQIEYFKSIGQWPTEVIFSDAQPNQENVRGLLQTFVNILPPDKKGKSQEALEKVSAKLQS